MQQSIPFKPADLDRNYRERLISLLSSDMDFHDQHSNYATHDCHSFPAKFPPQLPRKFIEELTNPGEVVLDPMGGSGTTVLEALLTGRYGIGFDIDPLALKISKAKTDPINLYEVYTLEKEIINRARLELIENHQSLEEAWQRQWDSDTLKFITHWFAPETQLELCILAKEIARIKNLAMKNFFEIALSSIIITKSGGVSLALDLAHTRPHRAKIVLAKNGNIIFDNKEPQALSPRMHILKKTIRSAFDEFQKRIQQNLRSLAKIELNGSRMAAVMADAQGVPLKDNCIDLIVTSPPYAANAIDYMRAHKFSLVWFGYQIGHLGQLRKHYVGGEVVKDILFEEIPDNTKMIINALKKRDEKKGRVLHRYYSEMKRIIKEMFRVLRPQKAAIVVVGNSTIRGINTEIHLCLAEIGKSMGFEVPKVGVRKLDRNRRMLPAGFKINQDSQIQQRMHEEYVIGFYKPGN
ncbi:MAG: DNA methyltransferase [Thermodesulfobacteriota bacterium]